MESNGTDKNPRLINTYFQNVLTSDVFDQISNKDIIIEPGCVTIKNIKSQESSDQSQKENTSTSNKEPIICRIFASDNKSVVNLDEKPAEKTFFDTLGSSVAYSSIVSPQTDSNLQINKPVTCNSILLPEFPNEGSFLSASLGIDIDNEAVNDEIFMKGASCSYTSSNKNSVGEQDRRRDAWIPSSRTRQALVAAATALPGTYVLDKELMTMPGVVLQEDMIDNIHEAVNHYLGEVEAAQRNVLSLNDVTQDERGLRELIQAECYRAAVNLTSRLLTMYGQGIGRAGCPTKHTLHSIQLWFTRIALLVKLKSWSVAWAEAEPWWDLDRPDLYFQFYSELYGGRPGTIVPFSFRLLLAELPQYVHKPQEAFKRLFSILSIVRQIIQNLDRGVCEDGSHIEIDETDREESKKLWKARETRILHSVVNLAFQQKDYKLSVDTLKDLINHHDPQTSVHHHRALISALGRVYLQIGDLNSAKNWFEKSHALKSSNQTKVSSDFLELVDLGLLAISNSNYAEGCEYFQKASMKDPTNIMVKNNVAVCLLYCGKQKEAVNLLEAVVSTNPTVGLHESLLLNLCTLYELESSTAMENKYKMLKMISKYKGDAISLHCLKLQMKES